MEESSFAEILKDQYGMTDEEIDAILGLGSLEAQSNFLGENIGYQQDVLGQGAPQGVYMRGRYLPPAPMEQAAYGLRQGIAGYERLRDRQARRDLQAQMTQRMSDFLRAGRGARTPVAPARTMNTPWGGR